MSRKLSLCMLVSALFSSAWAQEFPIGIWFIGNQKGLDSLSNMQFTWIHSYGGYDANDNNSNYILQNNRNLKLVAVRERHINLPSFAQRMEYQAELTDSQNGTRNYFDLNPTGEVGIRPGPNTDVWLANVDDHDPGYMVQSPIPNNQYFYDRMHWVATANISIDPTGNSSAQVARIEIVNGGNPLAQRIITEGEFSGTAFRTFEVAYTLPAPPPAPPRYKLPVTYALTAQNNPVIDVRVHWYDQVNTYLDWVALEDSVINPTFSGAYQLFRGQKDADITADAQLFVSQTTYPLLQRFYLRDEPRYNGYQPFNYVDNRIRTTVTFEGASLGRGRSVTATPNFLNEATVFDRFMSDTDPHELFVDAYPINANVPADPDYISNTDAITAGITAFSTVANYNNALQSRFIDMITYSFVPAIQTANGQGVPWWYIAQTHGTLCCGSGKYRQGDGISPFERPPSPAEMHALVNLALAYGAKGIFYFSFSTFREKNFSGCKVFFPGLTAYDSTVTDQYPRNMNAVPNHSSNYDNFQGQCANVFTGYKKKYDAVKAINATLATLGPTLANLTWRAGHSIHANVNEPINSTYKLYDVTSKVVGGATDAESDTYVEAGILQNGAINHYMVVNRRCHSTETREITLTLQGNSNYAYRITDVASGGTTTCYLGSGITTFSIHARARARTRETAQARRHRRVVEHDQLQYHVVGQL